MSRKHVILVTLLMITAFRMAAQSGPSTFEFIENKGQWDSRVKFKGELPAGEFYLQQKGFTIVQHNPQDLQDFFEKRHSFRNTQKSKNNRKGDRTTAAMPDNGLPESAEPYIIRSHAYRVQFQGGSDLSNIIPEKAVPSYNNYFIGNDPSKWASHAKIYQAITYKNVYPNIDVRYYSESGQLKYDLIIHPGGDPAAILMKYEGADKLQVRNNELVVKTSVGDVRELYPYSYQFDKTTGKKDISCSYELVDKNTVRFKVSDYSKSSTLVIDPTLVFSSFTGSSAGQWGFTATPGPDGSLYSGGIVFGNGFPVSPGAFQSSFQGGGSIYSTGGVDIGIFKFSSNGTAKAYATYLGGNGNDFPHSLICDPSGNLVVMGRTYSTNYPGTKVGPGGSSDIIVTKLNADGTGLIGSLQIGGTSSDGTNVRDQTQGGSGGPSTTMRFYGDDSRSEVILDNSGNIYVAAQTQSSNFPVTGTVFQPTLGGQQDGAVIKINPTCTGVIWSSFLGGSGNDGAFVLSISPETNDIYVAGATASNDFPNTTAGVYQPSFQGGNTDGFIAHISNDGSTHIKTTYMGTNSFDAVYGIQFDRYGFPYIMGVSEGTWTPVNAAYSNPGSRQFIAKLQKDLSGFVYTTVFGSGAPRPNISPVAFLVDRCENVYVSGWGGWLEPTTGNNDPYSMSGTVGMPTTPDAIKSVTDNRDFYFIVIRKDAASLLYGSFFGQSGGEGEHVDGGTSRYDQQGVIYQAICANCFGAKNYPITVPYPITPGAVGPVNGTGTDNCNLAAVKIAFNFAGVGSGPKAYINNVFDTVGCIPMTITFRDTVLNAKSYIWDFGDGTPEFTTTDVEVSHTYTAVGTYRIMLVAVDSTTCNITDTAYITVHARDDQALLDFTATKVGPCESLSYRFDNLSGAPAGKPFGAASFTWDFGDGTRVPSGPGSVTHAYAAAGTYNVRLILTDTNYCNAPDSMEMVLRISPNVEARFETPATGCAPYEAFFNNTSLAGQTFSWSFGDGATSADVNPSHLYASPGTYTIKLVAVDPNTCNVTDSVEHTIIVSEKPKADFNTTPVPALENTPTVFYNLSTGGVRYKWLFGDGDSTVTTSLDTVVHQYNASGTYNACLITYNQYECTDTACKPVQAVIVPVLDVPNAFTPGRFGRNSTVQVEGFGIGRMIFTIYNRWGQKVFETANRKLGWDGTFKGQPQPMDVYAYTLDVEFTDGTRTRKTGDITLIR